MTERIVESFKPGPTIVSHTTLPAYRFLILWRGQVEAVFAECSGLTAEVEMQEYKEGGQNDYVHKLPGRRKWSNITLKRGMTNSISLWQWFQNTVAGQGGVPKFKRKEISIELYDESHTRKMQWTVKDALPIKWEGPALKVEGNTVAVETLVLTHNGFKLKHEGGLP